MREFDSRRGHKPICDFETSQSLPNCYDEGIPHCILRMQNQHPPLLAAAGLLLLGPHSRTIPLITTVAPPGPIGRLSASPTWQSLPMNSTEALPRLTDAVSQACVDQSPLLQLEQSAMRKFDEVNTATGGD